MWSEESIPDFSNMLKVKNPSHNSDWTVLKGFWHQGQKDSEIDKGKPKLSAWFRINPIIINKNDYGKLLAKIQGEKLIDPHTVSIPSTSHQGFLGEYPWHQSCQFLSGWREPVGEFHNCIPVKHLVPISKYEWESGGVDYSLDSSLGFYLPAKELIEGLDLVRSHEQIGEWADKSNQTVFLDPSLNETGASYALIRSETLQVWMDKNDFELVWLIGGEKQLYGSYSSKFYGRLEFSGIYQLGKGSPSGDIWFNREEPGK